MWKYLSAQCSVLIVTLSYYISEVRGWEGDRGGGEWWDNRWDEEEEENDDVGAGDEEEENDDVFVVNPCYLFVLTA